MNLPALSADQMREVDRLMVEQYGIQLLQMMENAGHNLALLARRILSTDDEEDPLQDRPIVVLAGRGNNGGGGLAAARHLLNWGAWVQIVLTHPPSDLPPGAMKDQLSILQKMDAPLAWAEEGWELPPADLVIDALIGYGLSGDPRGRTADLIQLANSSVAPILSLDAPSGLDTTSGQLFVPLCRSDRHHDFGPSQTRSVAATRTRGQRSTFPRRHWGAANSVRTLGHGCAASICQRHSSAAPGWGWRCFRRRVDWRA